MGSSPKKEVLVLEVMVCKRKKSNLHSSGDRYVPAVKYTMVIRKRGKKTSLPALFRGGLLYIWQRETVSRG